MVAKAAAYTASVEALDIVEKATAATKESSKGLIEAARIAQLNCKSTKYDEHLKIISKHALDKTAWEAAETERAAAAKKLSDD